MTRRRITSQALSWKMQRFSCFIGYNCHHSYKPSRYELLLQSLRYI